MLDNVLIYNYIQLYVSSSFLGPWNSHGKYLHHLLWRTRHARFMLTGFKKKNKGQKTAY